MPDALPEGSDAVRPMRGTDVPKWDAAADVVVVGYGFAGAAAPDGALRLPRQCYSGTAGLRPLLGHLRTDVVGAVSDAYGEAVSGLCAAGCRAVRPRSLLAR